MNIFLTRVVFFYNENYSFSTNLHPYVLHLNNQNLNYSMNKKKEQVITIKNL